MLTNLRISHLATIELLELSLDSGFIVLTGETGSGKSAIIKAIQLAIGKKTDYGLIRDQCEKLSVEAIFDIKKLPHTQKLLSEAEIDFDDALIVRRIIKSAGSQRIFLNDVNVNLRTLEAIGSSLVQIHGQHENKNLLDRQAHLTFLDTFGNLKTLHVYDLYHAWHDAQKLLCKIQQQLQERALRIDLLDYQIREITDAQLRENEEQELQEESKKLVNAQKLATLSYDIIEQGIESDLSILSHLDKTRDSLSHLVQIDPSLEPLLQSAEDAFLQLQETFYQVSDYHSKVEFCPERIEQINSRLNTIQQLKRKYGRSLDEILAFLEKAKAERTQLEHLELEVEETEKRLLQLTKELENASQKLSQQRSALATQFDAQVCRQLHDLGMPNAQFQANVQTRSSEKTPPYSENGIDLVQFYFSANLGQEMRPLEKIASGGELSRVMLAIKTVLRQQDEYCSIIFDEIDAGISGRIAEMVGEKILSLSQERQTICITHLPQIASFAQQHIVVSKTTKQGAVYTKAQTLTQKNLPLGLAKLIGGKTVSSQAIETAEEMLASSLQKSKKKDLNH